MKVDFLVIESKAKEFGGWYDYSAEQFKFPTPAQARAFDRWLINQRTA